MDNLTKKESNKQALSIANEEGIGYAVTNYCNGDDFVDPKTKKLWNKAGEILRKLQKHLEKSTNEED